jgi:hypothetical protein
LALRTIWKQTEKIKECCKSAIRMAASTSIQIRAMIMEKLEWVLEMGNSRNVITDMAIIFGFLEVDEPTVEQLFQFHLKELSNENLLKQEKQLNYEDYETSAVMPVTHLSTKQLTELFKHIDTATGIIDNNDANKEEKC